MKKEKTKILIVEKSDIIRKGVVSILLEKNNILPIVEQCDEDYELHQAFNKFSPNIIIATPSFFDKDKKQRATLKQKHQFLTVGLIYAYHHPNDLTDLDALIHLNDKPEKIISTINELIKNPKSNNKTPTGDSLTERETEVLKLVVSGYSTKQTAKQLFISTHTVNAHRKNIMRKLDIKTVSALTIYAVLNNIISLEEV